MARFALFFIVLLFVAPAARGDALDSAKAAWDEMKHGDFDTAIHLYTHAIQSRELSDNNLTRAYRQRGAAFLLNYQYEEAIKDFGEVINRDSGDAEALSNRAITYRELEEYKKAIIDLNEALRVDASFILAWVTRGVVHADMGEFERAIRDLDEAIRLDPHYANAWYNRGNTYVQMGEYGKAISDYDKSLRLDPPEEDAGEVREAREEAYRLKNQ